MYLPQLVQWSLTPSGLPAATFVFCILLCTVHRFNLARLNRKLAARDEAEANGKELSLIHI